MVILLTYMKRHKMLLIIFDIQLKCPHKLRSSWFNYNNKWHVVYTLQKLFVI